MLLSIFVVAKSLTVLFTGHTSVMRPCFLLFVFSCGIFDISLLIQHWTKWEQQVT